MIAASLPRRQEASETPASECRGPAGSELGTLTARSRRREGSGLGIVAWSEPLLRCLAADTE